MKVKFLYEFLFLFGDARTFVPPYIRTSVYSISGLTYDSTGVPVPSSAFSIIARGLIPASGNITVTPSSNIEVYDGSAWNQAPFTVAYSGGGLTSQSIYQVRLANGLTPGSYTESVVFSGANASNYTLPVTGAVSAVSNDVAIYEYYHYT